MPLNINFFIDSKKWPQNALPAIRKAVRATLSYCEPNNVRKLNVDVTLTNNRAIQNLNLQWRAIDKPTDVLSFPTGALQDLKSYPPQAPLPLGDIILAHDYCAKTAQIQGKTLPAHLAHLTVHAMLHLLGYDHETDAAHRRMLRTEIKILSGMGVANPYKLMTSVS